MGCWLYFTTGNEWEALALRDACQLSTLLNGLPVHHSTVQGGALQQLRAGPVHGTQGEAWLLSRSMQLKRWGQ
jgi:hypothetical protein